MKKVDPRFAKFVKTKSNAAIKEGFKQEKRQYKKERAEFFEQKKREAAQKLTEAPQITREKVVLEQMPLNKYLAHGGVCSRREAADLIKDGKVKVNGKTVTEPGHKMADGDEVIANGKKVVMTKNLVYILMNKPKDYITTTDDPQKRKTVLDIIKNATKERVYPVGRLDRNTSGVLLITNDGELAQRLTHPSNLIKKIYAVTLDKPLEKGDFDKILKGVTLEDGPAHVDVLAYSDAQDRSQVGVEIHSGRNRIVRRIFESQGYEVKNLDRVMFAGLTKKNVERGKFRFLTEKEVRNLKYFGKDNKKAIKNDDQNGPVANNSFSKPPAKKTFGPAKQRDKAYGAPTNRSFEAGKKREGGAGVPEKKSFRPAKERGDSYGAPAKKSFGSFRKKDGDGKAPAKKIFGSAKKSDGGAFDRPTGKSFGSFRKKDGDGKAPAKKIFGSVKKRDGEAFDRPAGKSFNSGKKRIEAAKAPAKKAGRAFKKDEQYGKPAGNYKRPTQPGQAKPRKGNSN